MRKSVRGLVFAVVVIVGLVLLINAMTGGLTRDSTTVNYTQFVDEIHAKKIATAQWQGQTITGTRTDGSRYEVRVPPVDSVAGGAVMGLFEMRGVDVKLVGPSKSSTIVPYIGMLLLPLVIIVGFYFLLVRPAASGLPKNVDEQYRTADRLSAAKLLFECGIVTQEEYDRIRERILSEV
jgi:ATP-dependent Zn protease